MVVTGSNGNIMSGRDTVKIFKENDSNIPEQGRQKIAGTARKYDQISKDGDTLEISKPKISDVMLSGYSESRLRQLFSNKEISRQQYDKAVKSKETE